MIRTFVIASALTAALAGCSTNGGEGNTLIETFKREPVGNLLGAFETARFLDAACPQVSMELLAAPLVDRMREGRRNEVNDVTMGALSRATRNEGNAFMAAGGITYDLKGTPRDEWDTARVCPAAAAAVDSDTLVGIMLAPS